MTAPDARKQAEEALAEFAEAWGSSACAPRIETKLADALRALLAEPHATAAPGFICTKCRRVVEASVHVGCNYLAAKLPPAPPARDEVREAAEKLRYDLKYVSPARIEAEHGSDVADAIRSAEAILAALDKGGA